MSGTDRRPLAIHLGLPRTGTKTLQWQLFSRHPQIHYVGNSSRRPNRLSQQASQFFRDARAEQLFRQRIMLAPSPNLEESRELWRSLQAQADPDKTIVWSDEDLSWGPLNTRSVRAGLVWRLFRPCRILLTLREPVDHIESVHRMILRRQIIRPDEYAAPPTSIDEWLEDPEDSTRAKVFDHAETVRAYRRLFGAESVKVLLFEQLRDDPRAFFANCCEHFGVDPGVGADLYAGRADNARISDRQVRMAIWLRNRPFLQRVVNRVRPGFRAASLYRIPRTRSRSLPTLSPASAARIRKLSRPSNRWFRDELGLPLERYGYPV
ncbi:MAG: sulfotransferase [Acidobacteriota bacterium]|nr:sulfotransferase [Acidobacteriota bacterium]